MNPKQGQDQNQPGQKQSQRSDQDEMPESERPEADDGQGEQQIGRRHEEADQGRGQGRGGEKRPGAGPIDKGMSDSNRDESAPDGGGDQGRR